MNMTKTLSKPSQLLLAGVLAAGSSMASATVFDFTPGNLGVADSTAYNSLTMNNGGISVDISALKITNNGSGTITGSETITGSGLGVYVSQFDHIGVKSSASDGGLLDGGSCNSSCLTSSDPDEGLLFIFNQVVSLDYINFDNFSSSGSDDFNLTIDDSTLLADFNFNDTSPNVSNVVGQPDEYNFNNITGTKFLFWADADNDNFSIDRLRVSAIPEPSTLAMLIAGAGLLGLRRGKKPA